MSYYSLVLARTFKETTKIWNVHRFWAALAVPLSGAILRVGTRGLVAIGWREILVFAVFGFATCWVGSYLINLLRVPAILHDEQAAVIDALTAPPLSPQEQRRIEIVRRKLEAFPEKEKAVLQYIWEHGSVNTHTLPYSELDGSAAPEALRKGVRQGLLVMTSDAMSHSMIDQAIARGNGGSTRTLNHHSPTSLHKICQRIPSRRESYTAGSGAYRLNV